MTYRTALPLFRLDGHPLSWHYAVLIEDGQLLVENRTGAQVLRLRTQHVVPAPGLLPKMRRLTADDTTWDQGGQA